ncbi:MAG: hypothetical protein RQ952_06965 [Thermoproteota archaeon]|nr:hypothetical protein [Thermoproteota archaeon]
MNSANLEKYIVKIMDNENLISTIELIRYINPILIERIIRVLPTKAFVLVLKNKILFKVDVSYGSIKKKSEHVQGDVSFDSFNKSIVIYLEKEVDELENIGKVTEGFQNLLRLKTGNFVTFKL